MVKKKEKLEVTETVASGRKGIGWRHCEACHHSTKGARSIVCGKCGQPFPFKAAGEKKFAIAQKELNFGETVELLAKVKKYAEDFGGIEKFAQMVCSLEEITRQTGGVDGLKKALDALKTL
ncbi:MAG: hypothetical protein NTY19_48230 [Planctomycetota bacterium]|nr:hypothetical protein [Planctomycetota bacterium]